jgi:co-chaperonin GroES (HSP10)
MIDGYLHSVEKFVVVGDRVLIRPRDMEAQTPSGLVLPATVREKEEVQSGYVVKTGPGYPMPSGETDDFWKGSKEEPKYLSLQAREGDLAIFLKSKAYQIEFEQQKYLIVPHAAILLLIREDELS